MTDKSADLERCFDIDVLANEMISDASGLISSVLVKHARGVILGVREVYDEMKDIERQRDNARHCIDTLITNLRAGASIGEVLEWYDSEGRRLSKGGNTDE